MYFFIRTNNPRPTFHLDITPAERETMTNHVAYWTEPAREGISIVFGPVADPQGFYGIGVYRVADEEQMRRLLDDDPASRARAHARGTPRRRGPVAGWRGSSPAPVPATRRCPRSSP